MVGLTACCSRRVGGVRWTFLGRESFVIDEIPSESVRGFDLSDIKKFVDILSPHEVFSLRC